ncbi:MAG: acyl-CoA dehydrogenase family protein [Nannocystaceae bacterium]
MTKTHLLAALPDIASGVVAAHAAQVDRDARFPVEGIDALKAAGMMGAAIPSDAGGLGCSLEELGKMCAVLARNCASTAMIVAMHHIQVASLVNHAISQPEVRDYLLRVAGERRLIASGTSEVGPSGDMRQSVCFLESMGQDFTVTKKCTTVSYGQMADDILFQARRTGEASAGDQVAILATRGSYVLDPLGGWDTLGMRGTCSPGGVLKARIAPWQVLDASFATVAAQTQVPWSHILWSCCWLGSATDAVEKASTVVRAKARARPGQVPHAALDLSRLTGKLLLMRSVIQALTREYEMIMTSADHADLESLGFALRDNNLKLNTSELAVEIVSDALRIVGISAYKNDSEVSLGRHLRDVYSAPLMISNQRIHSTNASMLLVHKTV